MVDWKPTVLIFTIVVTVQNSPLGRHAIITYISFALLVSLFLRGSFGADKRNCMFLVSASLTYYVRPISTAVLCSKMLQKQTKPNYLLIQIPQLFEQFFVTCSKQVKIKYIDSTEFHPQNQMFWVQVICCFHF